MEAKEQAEHYRARIREMLKQVPGSVLGGAHGRAVAYKQAATLATKVVNSANPKLAALISAHNQLSSYY